MGRAIAYVDGFNLYHGVRQATGRRYLWLDLEDLLRRFTPNNYQLLAVKYFTARVRGTTPGYHRQNRYLRALDVHCARLEITAGRFQKQTRRCRSCAAQWVTYEEKESDVNLAIALVEDAALDRFDTALVVSGDGDLVPAVKATKRLRPHARTVAVFPPGRGSDPLRQVVNHALHIDERSLRRSQLPDEVVTANGIKLSRPAYWR